MQFLELTIKYIDNSSEKIYLNLGHVRSFNKSDDTGNTTLILADGSAYSVEETVLEIKTMIISGWTFPTKENSRVA